MKFTVHVTLVVSQFCSDDSVINTLCISGFMDDVTFPHNGANGPKSKSTLRLVEFTRAKIAIYDCRLVVVVVLTIVVLIRFAYSIDHDQI